MTTTPLAACEVHFTVCNKNPVSLERFKTLAHERRIKVITVDNGPDAVSRHVMTSSYSYLGDKLQSLINELRSLAGACGVPILREKVEIQPNPAGSVAGVEYYEMHVEILHNDIHQVHYDKTLWSVSSNVGKNSNFGFKTWMLTARGYNTDYVAFLRCASQSMQSFVMHIDTRSNPLVEHCIMDTNVAMDNDWMAVECHAPATV